MSILGILVVLAVAAVIIYLINYRMQLTPIVRTVLNIIIAVLLVLFLWMILGGDTSFLSRRV